VGWGWYEVVKRKRRDDWQAWQEHGTGLWHPPVLGFIWFPNKSVVFGQTGPEPRIEGDATIVCATAAVDTTQLS